jgi:cytochrome c oxidase subunit 2
MIGGLGGTLPIQGTQHAQNWDNLYTFLFWVCVFFFLVVIVPMVIFAIRYRARPGHKPDQSITHNAVLEFIWTAVPTVVLLVIFAWGWIVYRDLYKIPDNALEIRVIAKSWSWSFQYDDGRLTTNEMYVPVGQPIKLVMTSEKKDVLHSFFVPNFRIKKDLVPGMFTTTWFKTDKAGQHIIFCTEYCGAGHSDMMAKIIAVEPSEFQKWRWGAEINQPPPIGLPIFKPSEMANQQEVRNSVQVQAELSGLAVQGKELVKGMGCTSCHADDGSAMIGPSYKGIFGMERELADGRRVIVDENYIRESLEYPHRQIVAGFEGMVMPSYAGQLNEQQLNALIAYLKELK